MTANPFEEEPCTHICEEFCYIDEGYGEERRCQHQHCWNCGDCDCAGYCDDYQTYNLRPAETGGKEARSS